jgi:hypothetical protein
MPGRATPRRSSRIGESSGFDNEPAASLQLAGELLRGDTAQALLGVGESRSRFGRRGRLLVRRRMQVSDQLVRLRPCELPRSLTLREPQRAAGISEAVVTRSAHELQKLVHLTGCGRRTGVLTKRHCTSQPRTWSTAGDADQHSGPLDVAAVPSVWR